MKVLICIFLYVLSLYGDVQTFASFKEKIDKLNLELSSIENNDTKIDLLIKDKNAIFVDMLDLIKQGNLDCEFDDAKYAENLIFLNQRIIVNGQKNNNLAVYRDKVKLASIDFDKKMQSAFSFFASSSTEFRDKVEIAKYLKLLKESLESKLDDDIEDARAKYESYAGNQVADEFKKHYDELASKRLIYLEIVNFLLHNVDKLKSENLIVKVLKISYIADFIDNLEYINTLNLYLDYYFGVKLGNLVIALFIFIFYILLQYVVVRVVFNIYKDSYINKFLSRTVKFYIRFFILVRGFEVIITHIFYNSDLLHKIQTFYIIIFLFAIYKVINTAVADYSEKILIKYPDVRKELVNFLIVIFKILLFIVIGLLFLRELGYDVTAVLASLGVGGIAIALAAKDTLTNFFGLINIILGNSFSQGDIIKTDKVEGNVVEIGLRSTTIRTFTNELVTVPNSQLADAVVVNLSKRKIGRRIKLTLSLTYQCKEDDLKKALLEIEEFLLSNPDIADDSFEDSLQLSKSAKLLAKDDMLGIKKVLTVKVDNISPYSIDVMVYCFTKTIDWLEWMRIKEEIIFKIMGIIKKNNLEIAYPTNTTFLKRG